MAALREALGRAGITLGGEDLMALLGSGGVLGNTFSQFQDTEDVSPANLVLGG